jgi:glycosyltransferase involved in cell wall biosynthesis
MAEIIILSPRDPVPVYSGLLERIYQLATVLSRTHNVTVLYPDEPNRREETGRVPAHQPFERIGLQSRFLEFLDTRVPGYSAWRGLYKTHPWLYPQVRQHLSRRRPAALIVEMPFLVPVGKAASRGLDIPVILSEHNVQFKVTERLDISGTRPLKVFEGCIGTHVDEVVAVSNSDRDTLATITDTPIRVAPNGVDTERFAPTADGSGVRKKYDHDPLIVYHGSLGNAQNGEAVDRLCTELFPSFQDRFPDAGVLLVGPDPPSVDNPEIHATGLVDDLPAYIDAADFATVPLLSGSGTKLKILEYLATGSPVVTTPIGAEGLPITNEETALIEMTNEKLIEAMSRLTRDNELRQRLSTAGRSLVESQFSWEQTLQPYDDSITEMTNS